jgi:hypothetical protein
LKSENPDRDHDQQFENLVDKPEGKQIHQGERAAVSHPIDLATDAALTPVVAVKGGTMLIVRLFFQQGIVPDHLLPKAVLVDGLLKLGGHLSKGGDMENRGSLHLWGL